MFNKNPRKALVLAISTVLMWSSVATASKLALLEMHPTQLIAIGLSTAAILLGLYIAISGEWHDLKGLNNKELLNILGQGVSLFLYYELLFTAYDRLPAQIAQPINNTWAFVLAFANAWLLKEKLAKGEIMGMIVAYSGALIIAIGGANAASLLGENLDIVGLVSVLFCTLFISSYWIINNRSELSHRISLFSGFLIGALLAIITLAIQRPSWEAVTPIGFGGALYLGLFEWALPFVTWTLALRLTNSIASISTLSFFTPFLSLVWIYFILGEKIALTTIIGLLFIVGGTFIQQKYSRSRDENIPATSEEII